MLVPFASVVVPLTVIDGPEHKGEFTTGASDEVCTVTVGPNGLTHLFGAIAVAFNTSADPNVTPIFDQVPLNTDVVPCEILFLNTSMIVPFTSLLVPLTVCIGPGQ